MKEVTLPTVHLNGTGRATLLRDYRAAYDALTAARDAFAAIEFNARDYYVAGPAAWAKARTDRDCAAAHLRQAHAYLEAHLIHLRDA